MVFSNKKTAEQRSCELQNGERDVLQTGPTPHLIYCHIAHGLAHFKRHL